MISTSPCIQSYIAMPQTHYQEIALNASDLTPVESGACYDGCAEAAPLRPMPFTAHTSTIMDWVFPLLLFFAFSGRGFGILFCIPFLLSPFRSPSSQLLSFFKTFYIFSTSDSDSRWLRSPFVFFLTILRSNRVGNFRLAMCLMMHFEGGAMISTAH
jgi:hypothetical protein